ETMSQCVRFVSLIPFIEDVIMSNSLDIWNDTQSFLDARGGDYEEHSILLCNYFKFLKMKAWIVLGKAVPEGNSVYVLTIEEEEDNMIENYKVWNSSTGESFNVRDP